MTKVYSGIPPFRKTPDMGWPKFTPEYPPQWKLSESPSPRVSECRELLHVETLSNPDNYSLLPQCTVPYYENLWQFKSMDTSEATLQYQFQLCLSQREMRLILVMLLEPPDSLMIVTYLRGTGTSHCWLCTGPARVLSGYPGCISLLATYRACTGPCLLPRVHLTAGYIQGLHGSSLVTPGASHCWLHTGPAWVLSGYHWYT